MFPSQGPTLQQLTTEIDIDAPIERVWGLLSGLSGYAAWNPFIIHAEGEVRIGARLRVRIQPPGKKPMEFKPVITHVEPEREFRWLGRLRIPGLFDGAHGFRLEPREGGACRFVHYEQFSGLLIALFWGRLEGSTRAGFEAMNQALKQEAERL